MASSRTTTFGIRIKNETAEFFKGKPLNRYVERLQELVESGTLDLEGDEIVCTQKSGSTASEFTRLRSAGAAYGLSGGELAEKLMDAMDSGAIIYENGSFRADSEYNFEKFVSACLEKGMSVQKMIDKCTQMVYQI